MAGEIISCPDCSRKLRVPDNLLGKQVKCPSCGKTFTAEATDASEDPADSMPPEQPIREGPSRSGSRQRPAEPEEDDDRFEEADDRDEPRRRRRRRNQTPHRGGLILALGLCSLFTGLGFVLGPIAWVMGNADLREMKAGRMDREGESNTQAGRICGMIATILYIVSLGICLAYFCIVFLIVGLAGVGGAVAK